MMYEELKYSVYCDLYRAYGYYSKWLLIKVLLALKTLPTSKYIVVLRVCKYLKNSNSKFKNILGKLVGFYLRRLQVKLGIEISPITKINEGLAIPHIGGIVMAGNTVIGKNCTILNGVSIGSNLFRHRFKAATIGDNVFIGTGAKIIGPVTIGDNVTIGANSVVTKDIPNGVVVAGNPAKVISNKDSIVIYGDYKSRNEYIKGGKGKLK
ncbi:hypothetical protein LF65_01155 [Clostridium beijerinckii]|uniref:Serine acetyltransferase n=1 Tax=Clostridium beijerinckii TaxID=1520 RepID=A0A0B5QA19_CLOBE|nr:serine acetyltransferase [Clostridium beijerinckii]AJG97770.2 hypothetical protein LF65_01155 [Clostridium beijerinckii]